MTDKISENGIAVLDITVIDQMTLDLGHDATKEFLEMFQTYVPEALSGIQAAVATRNIGGVVHFSHDLKNSAATMGLMRLSCLCRHIETAADDGKLDEAAELANELPLTMAEALEALTTINAKGT
ncbi:MAG: Hpt domain-containing protein [Alphaproteobacteria bacterium]|jgi:HPt (histidine-containing phosphotransfer) domain-containing protein|nr:Hpt domain-containing protein [Alphaproteobacteria bacterium]MBT4965046.1 Hpt domain-containing protein [Alphaproteobacteria bacterium]